MTTDTRTVWQLARLADCADPDSLESPGAEWLKMVASSADDIEDPETIGEVADSCVPVYTHNRWQVFVDLAAYQEDPTDLGADAEDMTQCAGVCLYLIAERLLGALATEADDDQ